MENTEMSDSKVRLIQPTTDDMKEMLVEEYAEQARAPSPSGSNGALHYDAMVQTTDKDDHMTSFCQSKDDSIPYFYTGDVVETEHLEEDNSLSLDQVSSSVAVSGIKPESQFNNKQRNISKITELLAVKPDEETTVLRQNGSDIAVNNLIKLEKMDKDEGDLLIPLDITSKGSLLDVKPEIQCNIKHVNISDITQETNPNTLDDFAPQCQLEDDTSGYTFTNKLTFKPEVSEDSTAETATLKEPYQESNVTGTINNDVKPVLVMERNPGQTLAKDTTGNINRSTKKNVNMIEQFSEKKLPRLRGRTPTVKKQFLCHHCEKRFSNRGGLSKHLRIHTGEKPVACPHCDKRFRYQSDLPKHIRTHTGEKPFSCPYCDKRLSDKSYLSKHIMIHSGEKPFSCPHCDKRFRYKSDLPTHIRTHTGEKPFSCPQCDKRFSDKSSHSRHMRTHTWEQLFPCHYCDKRFSDKPSLSTHIRTHTGEKPFSCSHCDKRFNQKCHASTHMRTHTGEKPFSCPHCDKRFRHKISHSRHIRTHTREQLL